MAPRFNYHAGRFPDYWGAPAEADKLIFKVIPEPSTALAELLAGSIHVLETLEFQDVDRVEAAENTEVLEPSFRATAEWVYINSRRTLFNNMTAVPDPHFGGITTHSALLRRALLYAIDRDRIVEEAYRGYADVLSTTVPKGALALNASIESYPYDPEKARSILRELGYAVDDDEGFGWNPWISIFSTIGALVCLLLLRRRFRAH